MAHIFFEQLENRRSTQSLVTGYNLQDQEMRFLYGIYIPPEDSTPIYDPISIIGYYPKSPVYNPIGFSNPYSPIWNNPLGSYPTPWNDTSSIFGGIGGFIFPFWNNFRTIFRWNPTPLPITTLPEYPDPENITPIYHPMYGISYDPIPTTFPSTSYSPPNSNIGFLYGVSTPSVSNALYL